MITANITICHKPGYRQYTITLRMQYKMLGMSPIANTNNNLRFKPTVIPFLFLW
jgi:hypothetical protein